MSDGPSVRGPWNEGQGPWPAGEKWEYVEDPIRRVRETGGLVGEQVRGTSITPEQAARVEKDLGKKRSAEVKAATTKVPTGWSDHGPSAPVVEEKPAEARA